MSRVKVRRVVRVCLNCKKTFLILPSTLRGLPGRGKYCSASCRSKVAVHRMLAVRGESWRKKARETIAKLHQSIREDETKHPRWKGDRTGYFGVHDWITKHFGQPIGCEECGLNDPNRKYHWANISHTYQRSRDDFKRMCVSCHRKYDYAARRTA